MNIFQTIGRTTARIEPFHSRYLADALSASHEGDQVLIRRFLGLVTERFKAEGLPPELAIGAETVVRSGRVDITIHDPAAHFVLGIEVKTTEASSEKGQLSRYHDDLKALSPGADVQMVYLTPFNKTHSPDRASRSLTEFESHVSVHRGASHISWLQVADIDWVQGGDTWNQHRAYVKDVICAERPSSKRQLDSLFDAQPVAEFWTELESSAPAYIDGRLEFEDVEDTGRLISAFQILVEASKPDNIRNRTNSLHGDIRDRYLRSDYGEIHAGLFALADTEWAWVSGKQRYGLRVSHSQHSSGVSLCTVDETGLEIPHN